MAQNATRSTETGPEQAERFALFIGRWQPPHAGHEWLIRQKLDAGTPVAIAVRPTDEFLQTSVVCKRLVDLFEAEVKAGRVVVFPLPVDIESVNYGRGVGYDIVEHTPPDDIAAISATDIRNADG